MNISKQSIDELSSVVKLTIEKADYQSRVNNVLNNYRKKATLPGFRPGKVPVSMIQNMYGKSAMVDEINKLVSESLSTFITENNLNLLGEPLPSSQQTQIDFDTQENFDFYFDIAVAPAIDVKLTNKDSLPYYSIDITDEMLDQQIKSVIGRFGKNEKVDSISDKSLVKGNFDQLDQSGNNLEEGIHTVDAVLSMTIIKDDAVKAALLKASVGTEITLEPKTAFNSVNEVAYVLKVSNEDAEQISGKFKFTVNEITEFINPDLNQELFDQLYGEGVVSSEEEFRSKVKSDLQSALDMESDYRFQIDARDSLVEKFAMSLPEEFLARWVRATNRDNEKLTEEQINSELPKFYQDLKWQLIKSKLVEQNEIKIEQADILENAKKAARIQFMQYGLTSIPEEYLVNYAGDMLKKEDKRRQFAEAAVGDKVLAFIKQNVSLSNKVVSRDEFNKLFENN